MKKGIVYCIESNGLKYVGSTDRTIKQRLYNHRCWELYDMNKFDYSVKTLEEVEYNEKIELRQREQYYMNIIECCNQLRAVGVSRKVYDKITYERHKERILKRMSEYQKTDQAKIKAKIRYQKNKHKIFEYETNPINKARRNKNMRKLRERKITWGGDPRNNNNLLSIDIDIFHY